MLVILDRCDSPEGLLYVLLHLLLLQKLLHSNDMSDVASIGPRLEGDHLVVVPSGSFTLISVVSCFPLGSAGSTYGIGGRFAMFPLLHSESLSPSGRFFALELMIGTRSDLVSRKSFLKKLLEGDFLIQPNVLPNIFAESKILDLVLGKLASYVDVPQPN